MKDYFYNLLFRYLSVYIQKNDSVVEIMPQHTRLFDLFNNEKKMLFVREENNLGRFSQTVEKEWDELNKFNPDYIILNGNIHYEKDIQKLFDQISLLKNTGYRLIILYYSSIWMPLSKIATMLGWREKMPEHNWISHEDIENFMSLSNFEIIKRESKILVPFNIPYISDFINRFIAPLPFFNAFSFVNIAIAKSSTKENKKNKESVSVIIPARNEAGNIENAVLRMPTMGENDEIIFIEGHSKDHTWKKIKTVAKQYGRNKIIKFAQQDGNGKGDAVRKGFSMASNEILMILDADLTVAPEDLVKFYLALESGKGEFINGSRLVYPMEKQAMRYFNIIGNKFFAIAFSFVLGQRLKDTLCGTKVFLRDDYQKIAQHRSFFGEFDPFGDFDLLFGASRMGLKIIEIPVRYKSRKYGTTNIQRWRHGILLFRMLFFGAKKIKFV